MNSKLTLNLDKSANALRLALDKAGVVANVKAETAAIIDVSGSFEHEHEEGTTSILLERLVSLWHRRTTTPFVCIGLPRDHLATAIMVAPTRSASPEKRTSLSPPTRPSWAIPQNTTRRIC